MKTGEKQQLMKITYIVNKFPKLSETFVLGQITELIDRGHDIEIISMSKPKEKIVHPDVEKYKLLKKTHYINKSHSTLGFELNKNTISTLFFSDIIHAHFAAHSTSWALKTAKIFEIPFVFTSHAYDIFISPDLEDLNEKFINASKIITISSYNKEYLIQLLGQDFKNKIEIIRCGVDLKKFDYKKRKYKEKITILFVGRLVEKKGPNFAIEAIHNLTKNHKNIELRMIGDGPLKQSISTLINKYDLSDNVTMLGPLSQADVIREMQEADIFFLPSTTAKNGDREGIPVSIIEACSTGLPVVSTKHSGIPEIIIDGETGFLVEEQRTEKMTEELNKLINNPELRIKIGKNARAHVQKHYTRKHEIDQLEELFTSLTINRNTSFDMTGKNIDFVQLKVNNLGALIENLNLDIVQIEEELSEITNRLRKREIESNNKSDTIKHLETELLETQSHLESIRNKYAYKAYLKAVNILEELKSQFKRLY